MRKIFSDISAGLMDELNLLGKTITGRQTSFPVQPETKYYICKGKVQNLQDSN
jgi:hypothetical protein